MISEIFSQQPFPFVDSIHRINKIIQETSQEISYLSSLIEGNNNGESKTTTTTSPTHIFSKHSDDLSSTYPTLKNSGVKKRTSSREKNREIRDLIIKLGRLKASINESLLYDELKMWNFILEFCNIYNPKPFHEHECTVECCSEIPELIHTKLHSSLSLSGSSLRSSQPGAAAYTSRLGKTLDVFYNEEDRKFFQTIIIKNYMSDYDNQHFQRNYVVIISKVHTLFGCFPSGRLHMCHTISERRYETCSRTALICDKSGKAYCSFSGLEIINHWAENIFDFNQTFCSEDNIADMTYVDSTLLSRSLPSLSSSSSSSFSLSSGAMPSTKNGIFSRLHSHNRNNYNVSTVNGYHSSGFRLSTKLATSGDSITAIGTTGIRRMNGRHFGLDIDNATTYVSEKVSEIPKSGSGSSTKFLKTHTSKIQKSELPQLRKESASKAPSKKMLAARFGSAKVKSSSLSSSLPSGGKSQSDQVTSSTIGSDFDIMKPLTSKRSSQKTKKSKTGYSGAPMSSVLSSASPTIGLSTKGKDNLIRELIEFKRTENRINTAMNNQHNRMLHFNLSGTYHQQGDSQGGSDIISLNKNVNNNNVSTKEKFSYFSHFWQEKGIAYFVTLRKILDSIKNSCLILYWKRLFVDPIDKLLHLNNKEDNIFDEILQVLDHKQFDINQFNKESEKYFSTICLIAPKIYNLRESLKMHETAQNGSIHNTSSSIHNGVSFEGSATLKKQSHGSSGYIFSSAKTWNTSCFLLGLCSIVKEGIFINDYQVIAGINYPFFPENANKFAITMADIDREFTEKLNSLTQKGLTVSPSSSSSFLPSFGLDNNNVTQMEELKKKTIAINSRIVAVCEPLRKIITDIPKNGLFYNTVSTNAKSSKPDYRKKLNKGNKQIRYLLQQCDLPTQDLRGLLYDDKLKLDVY